MIKLSQNMIEAAKAVREDLHPGETVDIDDSFFVALDRNLSLHQPSGLLLGAVEREGQILYVFQKC